MKLKDESLAGLTQNRTTSQVKLHFLHVQFRVATIGTENNNVYLIPYKEESLVHSSFQVEIIME